MALSGTLATAEALVQLQEQLADAYADLERCRARHCLGAWPPNKLLFLKTRLLTFM